MNDEAPKDSPKIVSSTPESSIPSELGTLTQDISSADTSEALNDLAKEEKEKSILEIIIAFLKNPQKFFASLFGKEDENENTKEWDDFAGSPLLAFFEEIKETFSLTKTNTNPEDFNEKFNDSNFRKIMEFQKQSGKKYSQKSLIILWSNKENLTIKNKTLVLTKKTGEQKTIDIKNDKTITESIISPEHLYEKISIFTQDLEQSLVKEFSDIPAEDQARIPQTVQLFEQELKQSIKAGRVLSFSKKRIIYFIEKTYPIPWYAKSTIDTRIDNFLISDDGERLKARYKNLWKTA